MNWMKVYQCPQGCKKFFGSSIALNWHNEVKHADNKPATSPPRKV